MKRRSIPRGSVEYIEAVIETADDPASATVQLAVTAAGGTHSWLSAGWVADAVFDTARQVWIRTARTTSVATLSTANYPASTYTVLAKVTLGAEAAIAPCWELRIA